ncbi:MAG: RHS repeat-associated core domain-containing protein, partial [Phycisphaerales bacterium]|nr:RHS repeat-associated core domain-containing protein [Phycisphaerales bacterium]
MTISATYWALTDNQGTVTDILDSMGRHAWHGVFDSYGNLVSQTTAGNPPTSGSVTIGLSVGIAGYAGGGTVGEQAIPGVTYSWGYTGESRDSHTGLNYHRARWYAPTIGRFISEDPLGWPGDDQGNLYRYVSNNPLIYTDPTGWCKQNAQPVIQGPSGGNNSNWMQQAI